LRSWIKKLLSRLRIKQKFEVRPPRGARLAKYHFLWYFIFMPEWQAFPPTQEKSPDRTGGVVGNLMIAAGVLACASALAPAALANYDPMGGQKHPGALGEHKVAAVLVDFKDDTSQPFTTEQVREAMFTAPASMSNYFANASFNQLRLQGKYSPEGDVYDWVKVPSFLRRDCSPNNLAKLGYAANKAVENTTGRNLGGYDNYLYIFPRRSNCVNPNNGQIVNGNTLGNASFINSKGNTTYEGVNVHEISHQFGLSHANIVRCFNAKGRPINTPLNFSGDCTQSIYGDKFDPMGLGRLSVGPPIDFDAINKARLGWLKPENITTVKHSTTAEITPDEAPSDQTQLVQVPFGRQKNGEERYVYLDYRQPFGEDAKITPTDPLVNGVTIREAGPIGRNKPITLTDYTNLIDTNPQTLTASDAPLAVGSTYHDRKSGIKIKTLSISPSGARVSISTAK
jgi:hypothetical protein